MPDTLDHRLYHRSAYEDDLVVCEGLVKATAHLVGLISVAERKVNDAGVRSTLNEAKGVLGDMLHDTSNLGAGYLKDIVLPDFAERETAP